VFGKRNDVEEEQDWCKQYLDYLWELGELLVYTIGGFGVSVSLRYNYPYVVRIRGSSHPCANIQDVV
jgi:hypothetical protein